MGPLRHSKSKTPPVSVPAEEPSTPRRKGCGSVVLGVLLILIGIPMLVLPGPGLIAIGSGVVLVLRGIGLRGR